MPSIIPTPALLRLPLVLLDEVLQARQPLPVELLGIDEAHQEGVDGAAKEAIDDVPNRMAHGPVPAQQRLVFGGATAKSALDPPPAVPDVEHGLDGCIGQPG